MNEIERAAKHIFNMMPQNQEEAQYLSLAIRAICEKAEREKGCEYCTIDSSTRKVLGWDGSNDAISISFGDDLDGIDSDSWEFEIRFCPMCGRRLKVKQNG